MNVLDALTTSFYLVLYGKKDKYYPKRRLLKAVRIIQKTDSLPKLDKDEIAVRVNVSVPKALFDRPELTITINVDGGTPRVAIDAETMDNLQERMQELLGTPVHVTCDLPEDDDS